MIHENKVEKIQILIEIEDLLKRHLIFTLAVADHFSIFQSQETQMTFLTSNFSCLKNDII